MFQDNKDANELLVELCGQMNKIFESNKKDASDIEMFTLENIITSILWKEKEKPCVCGACVMCTNATRASESVHIVKSGNLVDMGGLAELNKKDIEMDKPFTGCKNAEDGECNVKITDIEGEEWQGVDRTRDHGEDKETLMSDGSYMICTKGGGIIYFVNAGQQVKKILKRMSKEVGSTGLDIREYVRIKSLAEKWNIDENPVRWKNSDVVYWKFPKTKGEFLYNKKMEFINHYKAVIKDAAKEYDLPELLIAGVAYNEYGGDPMVLDDLAYLGRSFDWCGPEWVDKNLTIFKDPDLTSFGNASIQVRRAWESLGYERTQVSKKLKQEIINSLKNPVENIYISAKHISDLRDMQYPGKTASDFNEDEIIIIATRYNRGPDISLKKLKEDTIYGDRIIENRTQIEGALNKEIIE